MPKRVDKNQKRLVKELRLLGISVLHLHTLGSGAPDILCGFCGKNYLFEIKDPDKPPSKRKLTPDEEMFHNTWCGQVRVVMSLHDILGVLTGSLGW
jgi:hypothetical protein